MPAPFQDKTALPPAVDRTPTSVDAAEAPADGRSRWQDFLPGLLTLGVVLAALLLTHTPPVAIIRYAAYLMVGVLIPGTLVHRALRGRNPLLLADLALGAATGLLLELLAWAVFMLLGIGHLLWLWPLAVIVPFVAVPSLRRHWRPGGHTERSPVTSWVSAGVLSVYTVTLASAYMRTEALPPNPNAYYIDVYWHMANAAELSRHLPPDVPSVAGRTLRYHWFSTAHVAASHLFSGVDLPTLMVRLDTIPVVAVIIGLLVAVARKISGKAWPGAVAAVIVVAPAQLMPWASWFLPWNNAAIIQGSPSQVFGLVPLLLGAHVLVDLVRGQRIGKGWAILLLAVAAGPGSKPAVLPVLIGGAVAVLVFRRRLWRPLLVAIAAMVVSILAFKPLVAQSAAGSGIKVFGLLAWLWPWTKYVNVWELPGTGRVLLAGMGVSVGNFLYGFLLVGTMLVQFTFILAALPLFRRWRGVDPAALFLLGGVLAGLVAMLTIDHPGASEIYFGKTATPFAALLGVWGLSVAYDRVPEERRSAWRVAGVAVAAAVTAAVAVFVAHKIAGTKTPAIPDLPRAIGMPLAFLGALIVLGIGLWWLLPRVGPRTLVGTGLAFFATAAIAATVVEAPWESVKQTRDAIEGTAAPLPSYAVTRQENLAAEWVEKNVPRDDIIATNVHCRFKVTRKGCDARAFWVAALTERRVLVESWAYTEETLALVGTYQKGFPLFPFDDPALFAANEAAFSGPTADGLAALCRDHHVRWLFADTLAAPVSPELNRLAQLRFSNEDVRIYELPPC